MNYCGPQGLPHSRFLTWDKDDRDKAIVWAMLRAHACGQCGTRPDEWDPALGGHDEAYVAELHQCWGCHTKAEAEKKAGQKTEKPGVHVVLVRNPEAQP
jgi:hypothetical protein